MSVIIRNTCIMLALKYLHFSYYATRTIEVFHSSRNDAFT